MAEKNCIFCFYLTIEVNVPFQGFCCVITINCYILKVLFTEIISVPNCFFLKSNSIMLSDIMKIFLWHSNSDFLCCPYILELTIASFLEILWSFSISVKFCSNSVTQNNWTSNKVGEVNGCQNCLYILMIHQGKLVGFHVLRFVITGVRLCN